MDNNLLDENNQTLTDNESEPEGSETDKLDHMAKDLYDKGQSILRQKKRKRRKMVSPKVRTTSAKKLVKQNDESIKQQTQAESESDSPWVDELMKKFSDMTNTQTNQMKNEMNAMATHFNSTISKLSEEILNLKNAITMKDETIEELKATIHSRDETIGALEMRMDKLERDFNDDYVIITSPDFRSRSISDNALHVSNLCNISTDDLLECAEWKKFGNNGDQVILRTTYSDIKHKLFNEIRGKRRGNCFISELLTAKNNQLFYEARKLKREEKKIYSVYTFKGQVYIRPNTDSYPVLIRDSKDLQKFSISPGELQSQDIRRTNPHVPDLSRPPPDVYVMPLGRRRN